MNIDFSHKLHCIVKCINAWFINVGDMNQLIYILNTNHLQKESSPCLFCLLNMRELVIGVAGSMTSLWKTKIWKSYSKFHMLKQHMIYVKQLTAESLWLTYESLDSNQSNNISSVNSRHMTGIEEGMYTYTNRKDKIKIMYMVCANQWMTQRHHSHNDWNDISLGSFSSDKILAMNWAWKLEQIVFSTMDIATR